MTRFSEDLKWVVPILFVIVLPLMFLLYSPNGQRSVVANLPGALLALGVAVVVVIVGRGVNVFYANRPRAELVAQVSPSVAFSGHVTGPTYRWLRNNLSGAGLAYWAANTLTIAATDEGIELYSSASPLPPRRFYVAKWRDIGQISSSGSGLRNHLEISFSGIHPSLVLVVEADSLLPTRKTVVDRIVAELRAAQAAKSAD